MLADDLPWDPSLSVLVVEDDPDSAQSLASRMRGHGHDVRIAPDGPAALGAADVTWPDAVLLDLAMPGMDCYELAKRLRQRCAGRARPLLVVVSGYPRPGDLPSGPEEGIDYYFLNPADPAVLTDLLWSHGMEKRLATAGG